MEVDRDGPTYTVDTLRWLKEEHGPDADLFFITGGDAILEIVQWKDQEELFELAHFIAATRPGYDIAAFDAHPAITVMHIPALAISSTDIRARFRDGRPIRYLVPEGRQQLRAEGGPVPVSAGRPGRAARRAPPAAGRPV